jgi:hypothetical protein
MVQRDAARLQRPARVGADDRQMEVAGLDAGQLPRRGPFPQQRGDVRVAPTSVSSAEICRETADCV